MNACKIAVGMGANVTILDVNLKRLEELDNMFGAHIQTLYSSDSNIEKCLKDADLVIGSVLIPGGSTPKLFKRKYLPEMKDGAVFVDVAIDQGGCGESSHVSGSFRMSRSHVGFDGSASCGSPASCSHGICTGITQAFSSAFSSGVASGILIRYALIQSVNPLLIVRGKISLRQAVLGI